jgi:hypothetical protein
MTYDELVKYYDGLTPAAAALRRPISTVFTWKASGIPRAVQFEIQVLTGGGLRASNKPPTRQRAA